METLDQLAINKKWIEEIADYNWESYGLRELRGIGIVERVYCSTTDNFYGSLYRSGSIASRFIMYMDLYVVGSSPTRSNNVIKETGVFRLIRSHFQDFQIFTVNFKFSDCKVFSKIKFE